MIECQVNELSVVVLQYNRGLTEYYRYSTLVGIILVKCMTIMYCDVVY